jgi:hypothetical protein
MGAPPYFRWIVTASISSMLWRKRKSSGEMPFSDASVKARELYAYLVGSLVQARIRNDLVILQRLSAGVRVNLGLDDKMAKN